jgi:cytochrome b
MNRTTGASTPASSAVAGGHAIRVWDLPTRFFHWALVALVVISLYTGNVGGLREMDLHKLSGYAILSLVLFRVVWGLIGSRYSRFADFVRGPSAVIAYARALLRQEHQTTIGHNPMGAWSVVAILTSLLVQATTGLFAHDAIFTKGPLAKHVSKATSDTLTAVHEINANILYLLIGIHLTAVLGYLVFKKENLIRPMVTGRKIVAGNPSGDRAFASPWHAGAVFLIAAGIVWAIVRYS